MFQKLILPIALLCAFALATTTGTAGAPEFTTQDLAEKVASLETKLDELSKAHETLTAAHAALEKEHEALGKTVDGWANSAKALQSAVKDAESQGFLMAGPNPKAKKSLLDGLQGFAGKMAAAAKAEKEAEATPSANRNRNKGRYRRGN